MRRVGRIWKGRFFIARIRHSAEQVINKFRESKILLAQGMWLNDGSCVRLRAEYKGHVWSYDFVQARTHDGRPLSMLTVIDGHTRECLAIDVARQLKSDDVLERLAWLMATRGVPAHVWSDNGAESTAKAVRSAEERFSIRQVVISVHS